MCKSFVFNSQALEFDFNDLFNKNACLQTGTNIPDTNVRDRHGSEFNNFKHKTNQKPIELKIHITGFHLYVML